MSAAAILPSFLVIYILVAIDAEPAPCLDFMSISLENGTKSDDGSIFFDGLTFPPEVQFMRDGKIYGCPCKVKQCIRRCCKRGEYHSYEKCYKPNVTNDFDVPEIPDGILDPAIGDVDEFFYVLYENRCRTEDTYSLFPSGIGRKIVDNYTITKDGILIQKNKNFNITYTYDQERYCIGWSEKLNLTKFQVCMDEEQLREQTIETIVRTTDIIGNWISAFFFLLTFTVYALFPTLRNIHGKTLMANVACMATAYTFLPFLQTNLIQGNLSVSGCKMIAYIVHFSFLASFFWLNVMCFDIWWTFGGFRSLHGSVKQRERKKFIMYSIYAWGCASIITIICMIMDLVPGIPANIIRPEFGKGSCWFESQAARAIYFYGPMGVTVLCNICLFILTALKIIRHKKDTARQLKGSESRRHDDNKQWFNLYLKLFIVMGINWSMEIISWLCEGKLPKYVWYITDLTNTLQGVIIFIIFVWKDKIKRLLMKRFGCKGTNFLSRNSTSRSGCPTSSTSRTCVTGAPLQEKINPYADPYRGKSTVTDDSDCI